MTSWGRFFGIDAVRHQSEMARLIDRCRRRSSSPARWRRAGPRPVLDALLLHRELGQVDPPDAHHVGARLPALDGRADVHGLGARRAELDDLACTCPARLGGFALVDGRVHVGVEVVDAGRSRDVHPEAPAEVRRVDDHRGAVDPLALELLGEELRRVEKLGPGLGHRQFALEAAGELLLQRRVGEILVAVVQDVDIAVQHHAVGACRSHLV